MQRSLFMPRKEQIEVRTTEEFPAGLLDNENTRAYWLIRPASKKEPE